MKQAVAGISARLTHSIIHAAGVVVRNFLKYASSTWTEFQRKSTLGVHGVDALLYCLQ